jgi:hypothetical protein
MLCIIIKELLMAALKRSKGMNMDHDRHFES